LLGDLPPLVDQLQERLTAITQAMALFELVNEGNGLVGQPEQHFLFASGRDAPPVGTDMLGYGRLICLHGDNPARIHL
jgi:hypothetical protein